MILYNNQYLTEFNNSLKYIEGTSILLITKVNIKKVKIINSLIIYFYKSYFSLYASIIGSLGNSANTILSIISDFFINTLFGHIHGFRLIGRGYKSYLDINGFLFRLGYSHNIYYVLPFFLKGITKLKFKKFWLIKGFDSLTLSKFIYSIKNYKIPYTYMHKGIYAKNNTVDYLTKSTKIGLL